MARRRDPAAIDARPEGRLHEQPIEHDAHVARAAPGGEAPFHAGVAEAIAGVVHGDRQVAARRQRLGEPGEVRAVRAAAVREQHHRPAARRRPERRLPGAAPEEDAVVYVDKIETRTALRFAAAIGDRRPLYCTSTGRVLLAYQPPEAIERYLRRTKLVRLTPLTITDKKGMRNLLARVRAEGLATTIGEATEGVFGIAAPVRDGTGSVIASIMLAGPVARIKSKTPGIAERVRNAGHELSRMMGYTGPSVTAQAPRK